MNNWAYWSVNKGHWPLDSAARAIAMPSDVAPTLSVMSQLSPSVRAMTITYLASAAVPDTATTMSDRTRLMKFGTSCRGRGRVVYFVAMNTDVVVDVDAGVAVLT